MHLGAANLDEKAGQAAGCDGDVRPGDLHSRRLADKDRVRRELRPSGEEPGSISAPRLLIGGSHTPASPPPPPRPAPPGPGVPQRRHPAPPIRPPPAPE